MPEEALKLSAADAEDIAVLSALLQDAVIPISEMTFITADQRFAMVANRFRWEDAEGEPVEGRIYERVRCGVTFDRVLAVQRQNFDQSRRSQVFNLLSVEAGSGHVDLVFAGGATVRLVMDQIVCHAEDFGEPWPTQWRPSHDRDED